MTERTENIVFAPIGWLMKASAWLPWRALYALATLLYVIIYKLIGYRVKIVRKNLAECFPTRDEAWLRDVERKFYRHFADYFVETLKMAHITDDEMRRRMVFRNTEIIDRAISGGQSIILYAAHYCNWEWLTSITLWFRPETIASGATLGQAYQPLENRWFDRYFLRLRERFNTQCFTKQRVLREMLSAERDGRHLVIGMISDQHPIAGHENFVRMFLNHPTAIITGPEAIARKLNTQAAYFDVRRVARGHYECTMVPIHTNCRDTAEHELTNRFADILEQRIIAEPPYWLWTHNRWKRPVEMPQEENG